MQAAKASPTTPTSAASSAFVDADDSLLLPDDGMAQELAQLEQLRRNVKQNLMLRPLSTQNLRAAAAASKNATPAPSKVEASSVSRTMPGSYPFSPNANSGFEHDVHGQQPPMSASSTASEYYSARPLSNASVSSYYFNDPEHQFQSLTSPGTAAFLPPGSFPKTPHPISQPPQPPAIRPAPTSARTPIGNPSTGASSTDSILVYSPVDLLESLQPLNYPTSAHLPRPLLLDIRPAGSYLASRIIYSLNLAIPSLILKRHRRALQKAGAGGGAGFASLDSLKAYVSTDAGRRNWVELMGDDMRPAKGAHGGTSVWNGEIIVYDEDMDESDPLAPTRSPLSAPDSALSSSSTNSQMSSTLSTPSSSAWMLLSLLRPLTSGPLYYLKGGITALRRLDGSEEVVVSGEWEIQDDDSEGDADVDGEGSDAAASSDAGAATSFTSAQSDFEISPPANITPSNATTPNTKILRLGAINSSSNSTPTKPASASTSPKPRPPQGLFSIRTDVAAKHRPLPEIEPPTTSPKLEDHPPGRSINTQQRPPPSPRAMTLALDLSSPAHFSQQRAPALGPGSLNLNTALKSPPPQGPPVSMASLVDDMPRRAFDPQRRTHNRNRSGSSSAGSGSVSSVRTPPSAVFLKGLSPERGGTSANTNGEGRRPPPPLLLIPQKSQQEGASQDATTDQQQQSQQPALKPRLAKLDMTSAERLKTLAQIEGRTGANERAGPVGPPKLQLKTTPARAMTLATDGPPPSRASDGNGPTGANGGGARPKLKLGNLNTASLNAMQPSNVLIVNTPSSPENSTSYVGVNAGGGSGGGSGYAAAMYPPPSPGGLGGNLPPRPRTPKSPLTPLLPPSPMTARPGGANGPEPTSPAPVFTISTILPSFLYLGPELIKEEHATELEGLGVKRILNIAIECDDDAGLRLRDRFKYVRIPMRDTVEEVNVSKAMKEVCEILDDARLHSAPTYVHCKAGKSRSVTAVMAYLIHANHWTLSKAYAFVLDRRKGISPNIGFVSELMNFEEEELGGKSVGVVGAGGAGETGGHSRRVNHRHHGHNSKNDGSSTARRRPAHLRESMPPIIQSYSAIATVGEHDSFSGSIHGAYPNSSNGSMAGGEMANGQLMSAGPMGGKGQVSMRDVGEEMEVRDADGRYRHARRAPVDELTLQPIRRVSKAGLETSWSVD